MNNTILKLKNGDFGVIMEQKSETCTINKEKQIDKILEVFKTDDQQTDCYLNTSWRITGNKIDEENNGYHLIGLLELANKKYFDRWANSITITVDLNIMEWEGLKQKELRNMVSKALEFYN